MSTKRENEEQRVFDRVSEATREASEPQIQIRQAKTRWELLEQLEKLEDALRYNETGLERELIRGMLVGNEANLQRQDFDFLGGLYSDLVGKARIVDTPDINDSENYELYENMIADLKERRARILPEMRRTVREKNFIDTFIEKPFLAAGISAVFASLVWFLVRMALLYY